MAEDEPKEGEPLSADASDALPPPKPAAPVRDEQPEQPARWTPPSWLIVTIGFVALAMAVTSVAVPAVVGRMGNLATTGLTVMFIIGVAVAVPALGPHVLKGRVWKWIAGGLIAALMVGTPSYLAWTQNLEAAPPSKSGAPSAGQSSNEPSKSTVSPSPSPAAQGTPSPTPSETTPTPTRSQPPVTLGRDTITLRANTSKLIRKFDFRISVGNVYESHAVVQFVAPEATCEAYPDVGDSMVETTPVDYQGNYDRWYRVIVDRLDGDHATLEWTVGTGPAPIGSDYNC